MDALTFRDVREILDLIDQSKATEVKLEIGETQIHVKRKSEDAVVPPVVAAAPTGVSAPVSEAEPAPAPTQAARSGTGPEGCVAVQAPLAGVFYRAPAPDAPPFVEVGQMVSANTDVCIIEAMKVMNAIKAGVAGEVVQIPCENEEPVAYHTPIIWIRPSAS